MKSKNLFQKNIKALIVTATLAFVLTLVVTSQKTNACVTYDVNGFCVDVGTTDTSNGSLDPFALPAAPAVDAPVPTVDPYAVDPNATDPNAIDGGVTTPSGDPYTACINAGGDAASCGAMPGDPGLSTSGSSTTAASASSKMTNLQCLQQGNTKTYCDQNYPTAATSLSNFQNSVTNTLYNPTGNIYQANSPITGGNSAATNSYLNCLNSYSATYCATLYPTANTSAKMPVSNPGSQGSVTQKPVSSAATGGTSGSNTTYAKISNPLQANTIGDIVNTGTSIFSYVVVLFGVLALIYTGLQYVLAQGNAEKVKELKTQLLWIVIGIAIVIGSRIIVSVVINTLSATGIVNQNVINSAQSANSPH